MRRGIGRQSSWGLVALALVLFPAAMAAQLQTGDLFGKVIDRDGAALPGATVTLTGVGAPRIQQTDVDGIFRFLGLYPGSYDVKAELEGFSPVDYPGIAVGLGSRAQIEMKLTPAVTETITVTGETPLLDERRLVSGANVSAQELSRVPTARDPWSLLSQAPGVVVDRVNVGGNESGQQSNFLGVGSGSRDNTFSVDGVVVTDMNSVGASATYFDFGAFEEVQFTTSAADVTVATAGVTVNQVTKRGTNDWRGQVRYLRTDGSWQSSPGLPNGDRIDSVTESGADAGGPFVRDHLWGWVSYGESDIRKLVPTQGGGSQTDRTKLHDFNSKLNFQLGSSDSGVLHFWKNDKLKFGRGAGPTRAPEATLDQTTPSKIWKVEDTWIASQSLLFTGMYSHNFGKFTLTPEGGLEGYRYYDADGVLRGTNFDFKQEATIKQARADGDYYFHTGTANHELKFGGSYREQQDDSITVWPHGEYVVSGELQGLDPGFAMVVFPRNKTVGLKTTYDAAWVQDTMSVGNLTLNAGLRWDHQRGENLPKSDPGNPRAQGLLPPISFSGNDAGGFEWDTIVPRLSVTYTLGEERKTLLRGSYSRYAEQLGQNPLLSRVNPIGYSYAYFYFEDANSNLRLDDNELPSLYFAYTYNIDPDNPGSLTTPNVNAKNLKPISTDELAFGFEQGFGANVATGLTLTYRQVKDIPELRYFVIDDATGETRIATAADYVFDHDVQVPLPNGGTSNTPVYVLRDGLSSTGGALFLNGDRKQEYLGIQATFNRRLASRWSARGYVNWADWKWKIGKNFKKYDDPTNVVADPLGYADGNDVFAERSLGSNTDYVYTGAGWSFGLYGLYQIAPDRPWGFDVAASVNGRQGFVSPPWSKEGGAPYSPRRVQLAPLDKFRHPNVITFDMRLEKEIKISSFSLLLGIDGFNLTNKHYVLQRELNSSAGRYTQINEELSPRIFRAGVTLRFN